MSRTSVESWILVLVAGVLLGGMCVSGDGAEEPKLPWGPTREIAIPTKPDITGNSVFCFGDNIYVAYRQDHIYLIRSGNRGKTWTVPLQVSGPSLPNGAPDVFVDGNEVHVAYTSRVSVDVEDYFQLFHTYSADGGESFMPPKRVTYTMTNIRNPRFVPTNDGIGIIYYETIDQTVSKRNSVTIDIIKRLETLPMGTVISEEEHQIRRCRIRMSRSVDNGRTFPRDRDTAIRDITGLIESFVVFCPKKDVITVAWTAGFKGTFSSVESRDGGDTWPSKEGGTPYLEVYEAADLLVADDKMHKVKAEIRPKQKVTVSYQTVGEHGVVNSTTDLTDRIILTAAPRIATDGKELYVVFSAFTKEAARLGYVRTDHIPPESYIYAPYSPDLFEDLTTFRWRGHDDLSEQLEYSYRFISGETSGEWSAFSPEAEVTSDPRKDGLYKLEVKARDEAGNEQITPSGFEFNTYNIPPDTFFVPALPSEAVNSRRIDVSWDGADNDSTGNDLTFSYKFDTGEWSPFSSDRRRSFASLSEGSHRISARSRDARGNIDPIPAEGTFRVQLGMEVEFTAEPVALTREDEVRFEWIGKDLTADNVKFEYLYRLDKQEWGLPDPNPVLSLHNIADGTHVVEIKSRDVGNAKNESRVLQHRFLVDRKAPDLSAEIASLSKINDYMPVIRVAAWDKYTPQNKIQVQYRVNREDWKPVTGGEIKIDRPIKWYSPGYEVEIGAADVVGNRSESIVLSLAFVSRLFSDSDALKAARRQIYTFLAVVVFSIMLLVVLFFVFLLQRKRSQLMAAELAKQEKKAEPELDKDEDEEEEGIPATGMTDADEDEEFNFGEAEESEDFKIDGMSDDDDDLFG